MKVTGANFMDEGKECYITVKAEDGEFLVVHVISDVPMQWSLAGTMLNIRPKRR